MKTFGLLVIGFIVGVWFALDGTLVDQVAWFQNLAK